MAEENKVVKEKLATILQARNNAQSSMTWMSSEADSASGATIGGLASHHASKLNIYAIQSYIDTATGTVTRADNIFGSLDITSNTLDYSVYNNRSADAGDVSGTVWYDENDDTLFVNTGISGYTHRMGRDVTAKCKNCSGSTVPKNTVVELRGDAGTQPYPCVILADPKNYEENWVLGVTANSADDGEFIEVVFTGIISEADTSVWDVDAPLFLGDTPGQLSDERPAYPAQPYFVGTVLLSDAVNGIIGIQMKYDSYDYVNEGIALERQEVEILSDGINITYEVQNFSNPTIDLPVQIGGNIYRLNTTTGSGTDGKAVCTLTPGTATSSTLNWIVVRLVGGVPTLLAETTRPTGVFAYIGSAAVQSAAVVQSTGALKHRRHTDALYHDGRGRISYIDERIRALGAQYDSGMDSTIVINTAPSPDTITGTIASGVAYQLHLQNTPSFDIATDGVYIANASGLGTLTKYQRIFNLGQILEDATGASLTDQRFNITLFQVVNKTTGECKVFANLPTKGYATDQNAYYDQDNTAVVSVEYNLRDCAVLLCRIPVRHRSLGGGQFTFLGSDIGGLPDVIDLRGNPIGVSGSGAGGFTSSFSDAQFTVFNDTDPTKEATFDSSAITTATSRTFTFPDVDDILVTRNTIIPPTSSVGLPSGAIWNNGGTLAIVP